MTRRGGSSDDGRYQRGQRRTGGEPLAASWRPDPAQQDTPPPQRKKSGILGTYGWRLYAVPVLVVLTVLALMNVNDPAPNNAAQPKETIPTGPAGEEPEPQIMGEAPSGKLTANIPSAELPGMKEYKDKGSGTWNVLRGTTPVFGKGGKLYKYTVEIENGIDASTYGGDDAFAKTVDGTLQDERSWIGGGNVRLQRVDSGNADIRISLTTSDTARRPDYCNFSIKYEASCWNSGKKRLVINLARWRYGAVAFESDFLLYRQYAINHEIGHAFGQRHKPCAENGALAPVMMQQSFGTANDYVWELNQVDGGDKNAVPKDGKVCRPNPWPVT
ncbi:DUF3152 domain-containing protein [Crossiella sp. CA-258035]|uniref:DUF3152 domain-containing protein n=1 Tax=Crossiella sp. CA-258035 TaxID=2981138 RepID=UPI0024BC82ED|nr:DUF3152 domain-containing protein [Crossiella sp. CA-258035]WHT18520.1 DUF3152 domain-containing protein [Crossiella sp. CA-258035]